jgi:hypothetical protein
MKNLLRVAMLAAFALVFATGCAYTIGPGAGVQVVSNIPYHTTTGKVVNGTNFTVTLIDDSGRNSQRIAPGGWVMHNFWNMSGSSANASLVALATDEAGRLVGSATRSFYISGYSRQSETWLLRKWDFQQ